MYKILQKNSTIESLQTEYSKFSKSSNCLCDLICFVLHLLKSRCCFRGSLTTLFIIIIIIIIMIVIFIILPVPLRSPPHDGKCPNMGHKMVSTSILSWHFHIFMPKTKKLFLFSLSYFFFLVLLKFFLSYFGPPPT